MEKPKWIEAEEHNELLFSNGSEVGDYYEYIESYDKHVDSIMPSEQAKKMQSRRASSQLDEESIRSSLQKEFEEETSHTKAQYASLISQAAEETKQSIQKYWSKHLQELERQLEINTQEQTQEETLLLREKEHWLQTEGPLIKEDCRKRMGRDWELYMNNKRQQLQDQLEQEVRELVDEVHRSLEDIKEKFNESKIREECYEELATQKNCQFRQAIVEHLELELEDEVREEVRGRVELEVKLRRLADIRQKATEEVEDEHLIVKTDLDEYYSTRMRSVEEDFYTNLENEVRERTEGRLKQIEKDLRIAYMRKAERVRKQFDSKLQKGLDIETKALKEKIRIEKGEVSRLKSLLNINVKQFAGQRQKELKLLKKQEEILEKKIRQIQYEQYYSEQYHSKASINLSASKSPDFPNEANEPVSVPSSPPNNHVFKPESPVRKLLSVKTTPDLASTLVLRNIEATKTKKWIDEFKNSSDRSHKNLEETKKKEVLPARNSKISQISRTSELSRNSQTSQASKDSQPPQILKSSQASQAPRHSQTSKAPSSDSKSNMNRTSLYQKLLQKHHGIIEPKVK